MKLYLKNMVCNRCKIAVKDELMKFGLHPNSVELGEVEIAEQLNMEQKTKLKDMQSFGFDLIDDRKSQLIEKIKNTIVNLVHHSEDHLKTNFSEHISKKLHHDYNYLSNLFSEVEGTTIENILSLKKLKK